MYLAAAVVTESLNDSQTCPTNMADQKKPWRQVCATIPYRAGTRQQSAKEQTANCRQLTCFHHENETIVKWQLLEEDVGQSGVCGNRLK